MAETCLVTLERDVIGLDHPLVADGPSRRNRASYVLSNGSELALHGLDKPSRLLSSEFDMIGVIQAEEVSKAAWEVLGSRLRGRATPYRQLIGDCNPEHPDHWIMQRSREGTLELWETRHEDNPLLYDEAGNLTETGQEYIARLDRMTGSLKQRFRYGIWTYPEGAIYDVFDRDQHIVDAFDIPAWWPVVVGIDPTGAEIVAEWAAWDPGAKRLNVFQEYREPFGLSIPEHARNVMDMCKGYNVIAFVGGGPSERQQRADWAAAGVPIQEPPFWDVWPGIDRVQQLLQEFALVFHRGKVPDLVSEVGAYRRKLKDGQPTDQIEGKDTFHGNDCLRYLVAYLTGEQDSTEVVYNTPGRGRGF